MDFIVENVYIIAIVLIMLACAVVFAVRFAKMSKEERYQQIRGWLLQAVIIAEKTFGSGTGALKLSNVYAEFCKQLPWIAKIISFETFKKYVDDALAEMHSILEKNAAIASVVCAENIQDKTSQQ